MAEIAAPIGEITKVLATVVAKVATTAITQNIQEPRPEFENLTIDTKLEKMKTLIKNATKFLEKNRGLDLGTLIQLVHAQTEAELYQDAVNYIFKNKSIVDIPTWKKIGKELDQLISKLESHTVTGQTFGQISSGHDNKGGMPPRNLTRFLLFLSCFPSDFVFNHRLINRISVAKDFSTPENNSESLLQQLPNWQEDVHRIVDDDRAALAHHFRIHNAVIKERSETWPEKHSPWTHTLIDSTNNTLNGGKYLSCFILLGGSGRALNLESRDFLCLRILSLRNMKLTNATYLKKLVFLQYLDLKHSKVGNCDWLETLEELLVLDLRYTNVEVVPDKCLENLRKLQHLLLGYIPTEGVNGLAGVELNIDKLKTENLETLRAIRRPNKTNRSISRVADLYFTGLKTRDLKNFWVALRNFEKLTSLGVAMTEGYKITLQDCPGELKCKLKRLRMEGRFSSSSTSSQPQTCLDKLQDFTSLIDLTLVSPEAVNSIPCLPNLICLRLYGTCKHEVLTFSEQGFNGLKKLVIGDMEKVKTVKIGSPIIKALVTLKLCNLPLELVCDDSQPLLSLNNSSGNRFKNIQSQNNISLKNIFLKRISGSFSYNTSSWSPGLKIYHYDMNKQCYKEVN